ncbi:MAG: hypothetical protein NC339_03810 [Muribaculaceae bacterium]|nr:hypothetical protein [Muribaculaceae bacterium]
MSPIRQYIKQFDRKDKLIFLVGLLTFVKFRLLGTFAAGEILVFLITPFIPFRSFLHNGRMRTFATLACLWLAGVLIADIYNESSLENSLKGAFNVVFFLCLIPFGYWMLSDKPERMLTFIAGAAISRYLSYLLFGSGTEDSEIADIVWGYYSLQYLFLAAAAYMYYAGHRKAACITIFAFGFYGLFNLSRYLFLIYTLDVIILLTIGKVNNSNKRARRRALYRHSIPLVLCLCVAFGGVKYLYSSLAAKGVLGEYAQLKYKKQASSAIGIASGRIDFFEAGYAIIANPLMGYGSFAKDKDNVVNRFREKIGIEKSVNRGISGMDQYMPTHSHIFGSWIQAGILGMFLWLWVLVLMFKFLFRYLLYNPRMLLFNLVLASMTIWDILFSPLGSRPITVFSIIFFITQYSQAYLNDKVHRQGNRYIHYNTVVQPG